MRSLKTPDPLVLIITAVVVLPLLYVLSLRPVVWLVEQELAPLNAPFKWYKPLIYLKGSSAEGFIVWYAGLPGYFDYLEFHEFIYP
jgi:hypothetical protein